MLKTLIKKELRQLFSFYFTNRKTGEKHSPLKIVLYSLLYVFVLISLGVSFGAIAFLLAEPLLQLDLAWLYFSFMGCIAILMGILGSIFNTYSSIYKPKDTELLISMPILPNYILFSRLIGVYITCFLFEAMVLAPTYIIYFCYGQATALIIIAMIIIVLLLPLFTISISALLGWVIALISSKVRSTALTKTILLVGILVVYYILCFNLDGYLEELVNFAISSSEKIKSSAIPLYYLGLAASGKAVCILLFVAFVLIIFGITMFILSKNFIKLSTSNVGEKQQTTKEVKIKSSSISNTLFKKELKRLTSSTTYMMNCSLGTIMLPALGIIVLINKDSIQSLLLLVRENAPEIAIFIPIALAYCLAVTSSMNILTAPSISLEGENLWILKSLPVDLKEVLWAKKKLHLALTLLPVLITLLAIDYVFKMPFDDLLMIIAFVFLFVYFCADFGLFTNLLKPNLQWTNEAIPVKQSLSTFLCLFVGFVFVGLLALGCYLTRNLIGADTYFVLSIMLVAGVCYLLDRWLYSKGVKIFEEL